MSAYVRSAGICLYGNHDATELWDGKCSTHLAAEQRTRRRSRSREVRRAVLGALWCAGGAIVAGIWLTLCVAVPWWLAWHRWGMG
jgi:hypothetical protein